jgi:ABC-type spermidine/putrescine transport system permease subunit I
MAEATGERGLRQQEELPAVSRVGWLWPSLAAPGVAWLILLFVVPFYAICAVAFGRLDPVFVTPIPVWNPAEWDAITFTTVLTEIAGGGPLQTVTLRTFSYVFASVVTCLLIGYPVAYYLSRHGGRHRGLLLVLLVAPFWISYLMRMLAWVNLLQEDGYVNRGLMVFQIIDQPRLWLAGSSTTVVLGLVYGYIPFLILPLYAALDRIDQSLLEAARDLGASPWRTFLGVALPLSKQGILAGSVVIMLPMFGDYYTPDLLSGSPRTSMIGNQIDFFIHGTQTGGAKGASLVLVVSLLVSILMLYYLRTVHLTAKEGGR